MSNVAAVLLPCDGAIFNGKWNLIGAFTNIWAAAFPASVQPFYIFCRLSGLPVDEEFELILQIAMERMDDDGAQMEVIWTHRIAGRVEPQGAARINPTFDYSVPVVSELAPGQYGGVVFPQAGMYELQALFNNRLVGVSMMAVVNPDGETP